MKSINLTRSWVIWACAAFFFCYQFILRVAPSVMTDELMTDFGVTAGTLGFLASFYFWGYAGMQLPMGAMLDRLGPRRLLTAAAITCALGSIVFSQSETVMMAAFSRFIIGAASACGFLSCMKLGSVWFPPQKLSLVIGLTLLVGTTGAVTGSAPLSYLVDATSWRDTIWITSILGSALAVLVLTVVRDQAPDKLASKIAEHHETLEEQPPVIEGFKSILRKPQSWYLAGFGLLMYVPLAGFADMWGIPFLMSFHGLDKQTAAFSTSSLYMGVGLGTPLLALLTDKIRKFKPALMIGACGGVLAFTVLIYIPSLPLSVILSLMFVAGLCLGGQFIAYSIVCEINPVELTGSASAFQNMMCLTSGALFQPLIGHILAFMGEDAWVNKTPVYAPEKYQMAMILIPLGMVFAAVIAHRLIKEVYPK